jgi:hypothetical protein
MRTAKEARRLRASLARLQTRIAQLLRGLRADDVPVKPSKPTSQAGDHVIRLGIPKSLELCASALRTLNLVGAHKILSRASSPNVQSSGTRDQPA